MLIPAAFPHFSAGTELVILNKVRITCDHLLGRLICVAATGTDIIDLQAASDLEVTVCNCRSYGTDSVAQHVFAAILALHTNLLSYHNAVKDGHWQKARQFCFLDFPIIELKGRVLRITAAPSPKPC